MDSIMTYITQCDQILYGILATILMLLFMMKLQHFLGSSLLSLKQCSAAHSWDRCSTSRFLSNEIISSVAGRKWIF